ncbi:alpha-glucosidase [Bacteroidia bacterium]|nr:alpha-glucosidase [Bacteroidia bacterium]
MKKYIGFLGAWWLSLTAVQAAECISFTQSGNNVVFTCFDGSKLSLDFCSHSVLKIWFSPTGSFERNNESFAVINECLEEAPPLYIDDQAGYYDIHTSKLRIRLNKNPMQLQIFDKWQKLLLSDFNDKGFVTDSVRKISYKSLRPDEAFFGLGEKTGPLNRRGHVYKMWNSDKPCYGVNEDPLYKSIPFFMSSYNYGIFFDNTYKTEFKFGTESDEYYSFGTSGGEMIYYFIHGKDYKEIIAQYAQLTGKPILPPQWAFGFSQCRGFYTQERQALEIASAFRKRKIPCDIIYQDIGWTQNLQDFEWRKGNYTNPKDMLQSLNEQGFKVIVSQDPVVSQANKKQWKEADERGYFTTDIRTGQTYDMPWPWGGNCGVVDFTLPEVADWWGELQQKPLDDGVSGFWTDMGEPAWSNEDAPDRLFMKHHLGMHDEIHNVYGLTWDKVVKEQFEKRNPNKRIFQMTRSAYAGLQRYTFGWSGDAGNGGNVTDGWKQLANQISVACSAGMGLIPFWSCDISGYCGDITDYPAMAELYTRWMQFGVFNPLSRAHHEGDNAVEPWMFGEETEKNCKAAIELKYQLFPYLYTYAREAYDTGTPILRALLLEYPNDKETFEADEQFLFGKELLVAPVVGKSAVTKKIYLPEGEWIDFNDGQTLYSGEKWITCKSPLNTIPIFVKKGSIVPMKPVMQYIGEKVNAPLYLHIYPALENQIASFTVYEDDGENLDYTKDIFSKTNIACTSQKNEYSTEITTKNTGYEPVEQRNFILKYHLDKEPERVVVNDKKVNRTNQVNIEKQQESDFSSLVWSWNKTTKECWVKIPAKPQLFRYHIRIKKNNHL